MGRYSAVTSGLCRHEPGAPVHVGICRPSIVLHKYHVLHAWCWTPQANWVSALHGAAALLGHRPREGGALRWRCDDRTMRYYWRNKRPIFGGTRCFAVRLSMQPNSIQYQTHFIALGGGNMSSNPARPVGRLRSWGSRQPISMEPRWNSVRDSDACDWLAFESLRVHDH